MLNQILKRLQQLLRKKQTSGKSPAEEYYADDEQRKQIIGGYWGNRIQWMKPGRTVAGWKPCDQRPRVGDWLTADMESGKTGLYRFYSIDWQHDPPDMFFAKVAPVGYVDDI